MAKEKKTYSLESSIIAAVEREAKIQGIYPSLYVNQALLKATQQDDARRLGHALKQAGATNADDHPETSGDG